MAYNTTPFHGKVARIEKNDVATNFTISYSLNATLDMADISSQGDSWKTALPGLAGATGSMEMHLVAGNTEQKAFIDNIITATHINMIISSTINQSRSSHQSCTAIDCYDALINKIYHRVNINMAAISLIIQACIVPNGLISQCLIKKWWTIINIDFTAIQPITI